MNQINHPLTARPRSGVPEAFAGGDHQDEDRHRPEHHAHADHESAEEHQDVIPADLPKTSAAWVIVLVVLFLGLLAGLFFLGYLPHRQRVARLHHEAAEIRERKPVVEAVLPRRQEAMADLTLPGDAAAFQATAMYPRANGYLKAIYVDIGDKVEEGKLLAEIDTPEVDAQLRQARAALQQSQANLNKARNDFELAQTTLERYQGFAKSGGVTQQQLDEKLSQFNQAKAALEAGNANITAAEADVKRLEALQSFEKITAPFSGTITARNYDVGALFSATNTAGKELFRIEQTETLRIFVRVPQAYATTVKKDEPAEFFVRNYPGKAFEGMVARSAGAIDPQTRTLRLEVDFPNKEGLLYPGMYGQVKLKLGQARPPLLIPSSSLVYNGSGTRVAVVEEGKIRFRNIELGRDLGQEIEVASGLRPGDWVISNPGERLTDGLEVEVANREKLATRQASTQSAEARAQ